jgi:hypothetical protein
VLAFERLAEERIRDAMDRGVFDHLPGCGKPLVLDDDSGVPEELRMAYRVLKNAGLVPEELELRRGITALEESLAAPGDATERAATRRRLTFLRTRLESRGGPLLGCGYDEALLRRLADR